MCNDIITNFNINIYNVDILNIDKNMIYYKKLLLPKNQISINNNKMKSISQSLKDNLPNDMILNIMEYLYILLQLVYMEIIIMAST